ncbi:hypothetical protein II906_12560, partial [bacterium]|nr:hypothetical protein [bacterium]
MNNNSNNWDESKHPRDDEGKFTFKGQGTSNPNDGNAVWERRANTFYPDMEDKKKSKGGVLTGGAAPIETKKEETLNSVKKNIDNDFKNYFDGAFNDYKSLEDPYSALWYTLGAFCTNFLEMVDADTIGADKYFHARANFDAAQQGLVGSLV